MDVEMVPLAVLISTYWGLSYANYTWGVKYRILHGHKKSEDTKTPTQMHASWAINVFTVSLQPWGKQDYHYVLLGEWNCKHPAFLDRGPLPFG